MECEYRRRLRVHPHNQQRYTSRCTEPICVAHAIRAGHESCCVWYNLDSHDQQMQEDKRESDCIGQS